MTVQNGQASEFMALLPCVAITKYYFCKDAIKIDLSKDASRNM